MMLPATTSATAPWPKSCAHITALLGSLHADQLADAMTFEAVEKRIIALEPEGPHHGGARGQYGCAQQSPGTSRSPLGNPLLAGANGKRQGPVGQHDAR